MTYSRHRRQRGQTGKMKTRESSQLVIVLCKRDGVFSLVEGPSVIHVQDWYRRNGPKAWNDVSYRVLPIRFPGQLAAAELWYGCKI